MKFSFILVLLLTSFSAFSAKIEFDVLGMSCGICVEKISSELKETEKVENVKIDFDKKKAFMEESKGKKITDAEIKAAVKKAGSQYEALKIRRY